MQQACDDDLLDGGSGDADHGERLPRRARHAAVALCPSAES